MNRTVEGSSCDEVISAAALIAAIAIEAHRLPDSTVAPKRGIGVGSPPQDPPSGRETPHDEMPEPPQVRERVYALAVTSSLLFAPPLSGAFSFGIRGEKSGRSPFRSVQVGRARTSAEAALGARGATFMWWTGQLAICPFGLGLTGG